MTVIIISIFILILPLIVLFACEKVFERTNCYKNTYDEIRKLSGDGKVDYVNTGSTFAFYGIDYESCGVKGLNLALRPQSLAQDFRMLRHYSYRYNEGATVLIVVSDLAFAKMNYSEAGTNNRYYRILNKSEIDGYNLMKSVRAKRFPVTENWKNFFRFYRDVNRDSEYELRVNENDREAVAADAYKRCASWMNEFSLVNLNDGGQCGSFKTEFIFTTDTVYKMIKWCQENGLKPVLVNLPVSEEMQKLFSKEFLDAFYYDNIAAANKMGVPFIDLQEREKLSEYLLYIDSCRLNKAGRKVITTLLLRELDNLKL